MGHLYRVSAWSYVTIIHAKPVNVIRNCGLWLLTNIPQSGGSVGLSVYCKVTCNSVIIIDRLGLQVQLLFILKGMYEALEVISGCSGRELPKKALELLSGVLSWRELQQLIPLIKQAMEFDQLRNVKPKNLSGPCMSTRMVDRRFVIL